MMGAKNNHDNERIAPVGQELKPKIRLFEAKTSMTDNMVKK